MESRIVERISESVEHVIVGLESYRPPTGRMAPYPIGDRATVIDDSYNANPISMRASLEALASLAGPGAGIAVVGDMGELGDTGDDAHRDTGRWVAELGIGQVVALGSHAPLVVEGACAAGDRCRGGAQKGCAPLSDAQAGARSGY